MQNIATVGVEFRIYPNALEKALISSSGSKQGLVEARSVSQKMRILPVSPGLSCGSNTLNGTRIGSEQA